MEALQTWLALWLACGGFVATIAFAAALSQPEFVLGETRACLREAGVRYRLSHRAICVVAALALVIAWLETCAAWPWYVYEVAFD